MPTTSPPIRAVAAAACPASSFTSVATTAKPLPASPARAASIVAFNASKLICCAMPAIIEATPPIALAADFNRSVAASAMSARRWMSSTASLD